MSRLRATGSEFRRITDATDFGRVAVLMGGMRPSVRSRS